MPKLYGLSPRWFDCQRDHPTLPFPTFKATLDEFHRATLLVKSKTKCDDKIRTHCFMGCKMAQKQHCWTKYIAVASRLSLTLTLSGCVKSRCLLKNKSPLVYRVREENSEEVCPIPYSSSNCLGRARHLWALISSSLRGSSSFSILWLCLVSSSPRPVHTLSSCYLLLSVWQGPFV